VKRWLLAPLSAVFRDRRPIRAGERQLAANLLADYAATDPRLLADLLMDADEKQFAVIYPKFKDRGEPGLRELAAEIDRVVPPDAGEELKERSAERRASAAVALLRSNQPAKVWPLLKHGPDPRVRSYLIHRLAGLGAEPRTVARRLDEERDESAIRAVLLALGEYAVENLPDDVFPGLVPRVQNLYLSAPDAGLHGAAEWLLRRWGQDGWVVRAVEGWTKDPVGRDRRLAEAAAAATALKAQTRPRWYVTGEGQTMVVIAGPIRFAMGSPPTEARRVDTEARHTRRIGRTFAVAAYPVTVAQYRRFHPGYTFVERYAPDPRCPVVSTSWYQAAAYCNWLSRAEGIPEAEWCYETDPKGSADPTARIVRLKPDHLRRTGYRLPTEAETEYVTRAGTATARYYGETDALLPKYAWYQANSDERTWPVGTLKPNDFGLFDTLGNAYCWGQEEYKPFPPAGGEADDTNADTKVADTRRVLRGGSFFYLGSYVRSAYRNVDVPGNRNYDFGFRVARTIAPE
jgi:hypothetical protein